MGRIVAHGPLRSPIEPGVSLPRDRGCSLAGLLLAPYPFDLRSMGSRRSAGDEPEERTPLCQDVATARAGARYQRRCAACPFTGRQRVLWRWVLLA